MAPTEHSILSNFLLPPASLQTIITKEQFVKLFPHRHQVKEVIHSLYRHIWLQRSRHIDQVKTNIVAESRCGEKQAREVARSRQRDEAAFGAAIGLTSESDMDVRMEEELHGRTGAAAAPGARRPERPSAGTVIRAMEQAEQTMSQEIAELEQCVEANANQAQSIVRELSDLMYGHFSKPVVAGDEGLSRETLDALRQLQRECHGITTTA